MTVTRTESPSDECFRCGYDLRGIANDRPCPECGLAAERSRRVTDELHETRPKWLRAITAGALLILLSVLATPAWPFGASLLISALSRRFPAWRWDEILVISGFGVAAIIFYTGILLLARSKGYPAADHADRWLRRWLRITALVPLLDFILACVALQWTSIDSEALPNIFIVGVVAATPLPLLLFLRLRGLAKRARSAHLAEHCAIVGIGATVAVLCLAAEVAFAVNSERVEAALGLRENWENNSTAWLIIMVIFNVAVCLFLLWGIYLLVRFVIAFARAAIQASRKWRRDDHALPRLGPAHQ
jgi:hypothetical protein